jgi:hypothetical protein
MKTNVQESHKKLFIDSKIYQEKLINVSAYALAVSSTNLPVLYYPNNFPDWESFEKTFIELKGSTGQWQSNILDKLLNVPKQIGDTNTDIQENLKNALNLAVLLTNPDLSPDVKKSIAGTLKIYLMLIQGLIKVSDASVSNLITSLTNYKTDMSSQSKTLMGLANKTLYAKDVNEKKVKELNEEIEKLKDRVIALSWSIAGLAVADAALITITGLAIASGPFGWAVAPFTAIGAAVATYYIVLDSIELVTTKDVIERKYSELNNVSKDVVTLIQTANQFETLSNNAVVSSEQLQGIIEAWRDVENLIIKALESCEDANNDLSDEKFIAVVSDIQSVSDFWNSACEATKPLQIQIKIENDVMLVVGMSEDEVSKTLKKGEPVRLAKV